jgi:adenylate cyclase
VNETPAPENPESTAPASSVSADAFRARVARARHDLRNPIGEIIGYSEMLQEEISGSGETHLVSQLQTIHRTASQILKEVEHRLDLDSGAVSQDDFAFLLETIHNLSHEIKHHAAQLARHCGSSVESSVRSDLSRVAASARRLQAIAPLLLARAEQYVPPENETSALKPPPQDPSDTSFLLRGAKTAQGTLLVVDDDESNRMLLTRRLLRQGYQVFAAENGRRALEMIHAKSFDLVLLDIMMPEVDGLQVLLRMKDDERLRHIPVIMISALDDLTTLVRCIQAGAEDYLTKPFDAILLSARIGACLEKKRLRDLEVTYLKQIEREKQKSNDLLRVILPGEIAVELMSTGRVKPRRREKVAVLFCDVVGFTSYCSEHAPEAVITQLQTLFRTCEEYAEKHNLEKIKTIGDSFMAAAGLISPSENPALDCVRCGLDILASVPAMPAGWKVRIGIHSGPIVAGVVGSKKYLFDIWGDTVNMAARVTSSCQPDTLCVSSTSWKEVQHACEGTSRGVLNLKGKGDVEIFQVTGAAK